jgi:2-keto-4-pentenoate hydratase/2-oxohepta-3-ene-1,7-dioic acid hydratase in catechol pathway
MKKLFIIIFLLHKQALAVCPKFVRYKKNHQIVWGQVIKEGKGVPFKVLEIDSFVEKLGQEDFINKSCEREKKMKSAPNSYKLITIKKSNILPPLIVPPQNIVAMGLNYPEHQKEVKMTNAVVFSKWVTPTSAYQDIMSQKSSLLDWEVELAFIVKKEINRFNVQKITAQNIHQYVWGLTMANDLTDRISIIKGKVKGLSRAKTKKGFLPLGPYFVPLKAYKQQHFTLPDLKLWTKVNDSFRQNGRTSHMIHNFISILNKTLIDRNQKWKLFSGKKRRLLIDQKLKKGDIVLTGTPEGTAFKVPEISTVLKDWWKEDSWLPGPTEFFIEKEKKSGKYLRPGDRIKMSIETLGTQIYKVRE